MADGSVVALITGGTAICSGLLGYGAARGQQLIERSRLSAEVERDRAERARAERDSQLSVVRESANRREALYLEYLRMLDDYVLLVMSADVDLPGYSEWWRRFQTYDNQMDLFALAPVAQANKAVYTTLDEVSAALFRSDTFGSDVRDAFRHCRATFETARSNLVVSMRDEVAANEAALNNS